MEYVAWGGDHQADCSQLDRVVQDVYLACLNNPSCEVIECKVDHVRHTQSIIVDFADGSFDVDNKSGILRIERLALTHCPEAEFCWEVRALRSGFPVTIHQNHVLSGEPRSLCLYIEPWEAVERSWTPELFLKRIFWWLRATAEGTIHGDDQPIEQLFFSSHIQVVLPENHFQSEDSLEKELVFQGVNFEGVKTQTLIGSYTDSLKTEAPYCLSVSVVLDAIENGPIEEYPFTLGGLEDLLSRRRSSVVQPLKETVLKHVTDKGLQVKEQGSKEFVLVLLGIPRSRQGIVQKLEVQGFMVDAGIGILGQSLSVLFKAKEENKWYRDVMGGSESDQWKSVSIFPVNVKCYPNEEEIRQYSDITPDDGGPVGIIAGAGALGGMLAEIWGRECWGEWAYVDDDTIQAHNLVRHISSRSAVGFPKAVVVNSLINSIHSEKDNSQSKAFVTSILSENEVLNDKIEKSHFLVDVTTTLHVPRVVSRSDSFPRTVSAFITPSGSASVMLLEDKHREIRCNSLEAQYYRAILIEDWGEEHLSGHVGRHWVGAGCREVTLSLSNELVHIHAATLARQIRKKSSCNEAKICVWDYHDSSGAISFYDIPVFPCRSIFLNNWEVIWDDGFLRKITAFRSDSLPNETGGVIFGIVDQKDKTITLVNACPAPENSESTPSSFTRGAYESESILDDCKNRTAGIVTYVGEWHSHPPSCGALPSVDDIGQLSFLSTELQVEGLPALMVIVSENAIGFYFNMHGIVVNF